MEINSKIINNTLYIILKGELDEHTANYTRKTIDTLFDTEKNYNQVVIDLSNLFFMDSTGIGVMIGRYKKSISNRKPIFVSNPSNQAEKIFRMAGLYEIMPKLVI